MAALVSQGKLSTVASGGGSAQLGGVMSESIDPYVERASGRESFDEAVGDARWASLGFSMSERLRTIRELRGLSQKRLATVAGLSRTVVSNL